MNDGQPLIEVDAQANARPFAEMAEKITLNAANGFGGALVIIPPEGAPVELLMVKRDANTAMFWGLVKGLADEALDKLAEAAKGQSAWGRR